MNAPNASSAFPRKLFSKKPSNKLILKLTSFVLCSYIPQENVRYLQTGMSELVARLAIRPIAEDRTSFHRGIHFHSNRIEQNSCTVTPEQSSSVRSGNIEGHCSTQVFEDPFVCKIEKN